MYKLNMEGFFMSKKAIKVSSVTAAAKGRELLTAKGYNAYIARNPRPEKSEGCGYVIYVNNYDVRCLALLRKGGIITAGEFEEGEGL